MSKILIIPGVSVSVVKEVLPQQLPPSGVLGLVGFTGGAPGTHRAASWARVRELCGDIVALSLPEARQALDNGVSELVIVALPGDGHLAAAALDSRDPQQPPIKLVARAGGIWANSLDVVVTARSEDAVDIAIRRRGSDTTIEQLRNVDAGNLAAALAGLSTVALDGAPATLPRPGTYPLGGGKDAAVEAYRSGLDALREEPDVDLVLAAVQDFSDARKADVVAIHGAVVSHCDIMSGEARGRIGLGQIGPGWTVASLVSDRFVLVAPHGVVGAVAGLVGNLPSSSPRQRHPPPDLTGRRHERPRPLIQSSECRCTYSRPPRHHRRRDDPPRARPGAMLEVVSCTTITALRIMAALRRPHLTASIGKCKDN